jgi:molybdate transport system substrate-binding protein
MIARVPMIRHLAAILVALFVVTTGARAEAVRIMAAFTFKSALDEVVQAYKADDGGEVIAIYGPTPALAKQVESAAPADIFLSADANWMNYLRDRGLIRDGSRVDLLTTDLVLVTRVDNTIAPSNAVVGPDYPLARILDGGHVAMCNPADHPAGRFGRAGLEGLGLWESVSSKVAIADSPPAAVAFVARGEAPLAVVFATDAAGVSAVKISGVFPDHSHPPILFPAALLRDSRNEDAARFLAFLGSDKAFGIFQHFGYRRVAK